MTGIIVSLPPPVELPYGAVAGTVTTLGPLTYVAAIPNLPQTWTALQSYSTGSFGLLGSVSGELLFNVPSLAFGTITWPAGTTDFSTTGGASQVIKQTTVGGPFTVGLVSPSDISTTTQTILSGTTVTVQNSDSLIVLNKGTGSATAITLPLASAKNGSVLIVDFKGDSDVNPITVTTSGSEKFPGGGSSWTISSQGISVLFTPISGLGYAVR